MNAPLEIPDAAWAAAQAEVERLADHGVRIAGRGAIAPIVGTAAPHIVAAELRRLADDIARGCEDYIANGWSDEKRAIAAHDLGTAKRIRARADQLDGGA